MLRLIFVHPLEAILICYIFSNAVSAMQKPVSDTGWYAWLYRLAHGMAGNILYAIHAKFDRRDFRQ